MRFDEGLALFISAVIGAGIFALPVLASQVSPLYVFAVLSVSLLFSLFLGYSLLDLAPADVEDEVERVLGSKARLLFHLINLSILLLSLTAYTVALQYHLKTNIVFLLILLFIPLFFNITFPAAFSLSLALFILFFLGAVSLANLSLVEHTALSTSNIFLSPLLAASYFAFFGHNMIPRIRHIVRNIERVKEIIMEGLLITFLIYTSFTLSTAYLGTGETATLVLTQVYKEPLSSFIALAAVVIFYTSFILLGIHLQEMLPGQKYSSLIVVLLVSSLYGLVKFLSLPFAILIASAGFAVSLYGLIVGVTALKARKRRDFFSQISPLITIFLSLLPWLLLIFR